MRAEWRRDAKRNLWIRETSRDGCDGEGMREGRVGRHISELGKESVRVSFHT